MRESVLRQAPAEISGRRLRDAILFMESRSKVAALALRHMAQELAPPEEGILVVFKLLEDELTRGDEALVYFEVAARDGAVWEWYGRVRMNDTNLDVEWKSVSRHGRPGIRSPPGR